MAKIKNIRQDKRGSATIARRIGPPRMTVSQRLRLRRALEIRDIKPCNK